MGLVIAGPISATGENSEEPFALGDFTWLNGNNRQKAASPVKNEFVALALYSDVYYGYNFNRPIDHVIAGSATVGRHDEFTFNLVSAGVDVNYKNAIGRLFLQFGNELSLVQETDGSTSRGRFLSTANNKYIREAAVGYHFNVLHGVNVEAGILPSFVGLESYLTQENWNYQRSFVSDFTPFYFSGVRVPIFIRRDLKIEPWVMNGWQAYGKWNEGTSVGFASAYRPDERVSLTGNLYYGTDQRDKPGVNRVHHDNSVSVRYFQGQAWGLSRAAFSLNTHYGFEAGGGYSAGRRYVLGSSLANRVWFSDDRFAFTVRGGFFRNPSGYVTPSVVANGVAGSPDLSDFKASELTATLDFMPSDFVTFRLEFLTRVANVPFFAGSGGTTGTSDGWTRNPATDTPEAITRAADLRKSENQVNVSASFRI